LHLDGPILLAALDDTSLGEYLDHADLQAKTSRTIHTPKHCSSACRKCGNRVVHRRSGTGAGPALDCRSGVRRLRSGVAALNVSTHAGRVSRNELEQRFLPAC
jgi:IclR family pca regulon transcriptional regulator